MTARTTNLVSPGQAKLFRKYMLAWQAKLNLLSWRVEARPSKAVNAMADVKIDIAGQLAAYRVGDFGATPITNQSLEAVAVHEMLHVLLANFKDVCQTTTSTWEQQQAAEHAVINTLERLLAPHCFLESECPTAR